MTTPYPFAPGAIEHHTRRQRSAIKRWLLISAASLAAALIFGLLAGIILGAIQP